MKLRRHLAQVRANLCAFPKGRLQEAPPASPIVGDFYAAADVKKVAGPTDVWCAVLFGYTGVEAWYAFKIREHEWMLTQDVGTPVGLEYRTLCLTCGFTVTRSITLRSGTRW